MDDNVKDGMETCEDLCTCGGHLRLHAYTFGKSKGQPKQRFYIDCPQCGKITSWKDSIDEAVIAFDSKDDKVSNFVKI